jgi:UDP-N-acetylmuramate--alanine ligase
MKTEFQIRYHHVYFIGIGGISMSGLAEILHCRGFQVSGSDLHPSDRTKYLESLGIPVYYSHQKENISPDINLVVYTAAVKEDNPELVAAKELGIAVMDRAHLLGSIMEDYHNSVAVSGTHGKTTTTSMVSEILLAAQADPTITVGGILPTIQSNTRIGNSPFFVAEACEYFDSFLQFRPLVGIILNVEADHLDYFKTLENIRRSFHAFAKQVPQHGLVVIHEDIENVADLTENLPCKVETFSLSKNSNAAWQAQNIVHHEDGSNSFDLVYHQKNLGRISLHVPGEHNITNALAACAATYFMGISVEDIAKGLAHFHGTNRRFQYKGSKNGVTVIDDYAHHPTEIKATLSAAKKTKHNELWCIFQPHTYSRTKFLFDEFGECFALADHIVIADIYAAREKDTGEINASKLAERIAATGKDASYVGNFQDITAYMQAHCNEGDILMTIGAGDVYQIGEMFLE